MPRWSVCCLFRPEDSHGEPIYALENCPKSHPPQTTHLFQKAIPHASTSQATRWKLTANGFSSYGIVRTAFIVLYNRSGNFSWKITFSFSAFWIVFIASWICVLNTEASCSSYLMKANIFWKSWSRIWPQAKPLRRKWAQVDSLLMSIGSKLTFWNWRCDWK